MNKYEQIKKVEETSFTLNDIYLGYDYYWQIVQEIDNDNSKLEKYSKEIDTLYKALDKYIQFRSNYKTDLKGLING